LEPAILSIHVTIIDHLSVRNYIKGYFQKTAIKVAM